MNEEVKAYDHLFKILLVGPTGAGKSCFLEPEAVHKSYIATIGVDFKIENIDVDGQAIKLQIWDTAGQERFKSIVSAYFKGANSLLCFFDVTSAESFKDAAELIAKNSLEYPQLTNTSFLIGNKVDREEFREVSREEAEEVAKKYGIAYLEASAVLDTSSKILSTVAERILKNNN